MRIARRHRSETYRGHPSSANILRFRSEHPDGCRTQRTESTVRRNGHPFSRKGKTPGQTARRSATEPTGSPPAAGNRTSPSLSFFSEKRNSHVRSSRTHRRKARKHLQCTRLLRLRRYESKKSEPPTRSRPVRKAIAIGHSSVAQRRFPKPSAAERHASPQETKCRTSRTYSSTCFTGTETFPEAPLLRLVLPQMYRPTLSKAFLFLRKKRKQSAHSAGKTVPFLHTSRRERSLFKFS